MQNTHLTRKQSDALGYIQTYIAYREYGPITKELAAFLGVSRNAALDRMKALRTKGAITFDETKQRSVRPVKGFKVIIKGESK